jgi:hypothetical protein
MNGKWILSKNLLPAFLLAIGAGFGVVLLTERSRFWGLFFDAVFLSVGVLLLAHAAFTRRAHHEKVERERMRNLANEVSPLEIDIQPTRFGLAFILAAIAGLLSLIPPSSQAPALPSPGQIQSLIQLLGKTDSDLIEYAKSNASEKGCKSGNDATAAKVDEALHRLEDIVKNFPPPPPPPPPNGTSSWQTISIVALALLVAGAIIWLTLALSPSKTPLAITAALVTGLIKGAKLLPQPGGDFYWYSIFGLLVVGGIVVVIATIRWKVAGPGTVVVPPTVGTPPGATGADEPTPWKRFCSRYLGFPFKKSADRPDSDSPMVIGFSILLLTCTMAYLGKPQDRSPGAPTPCPACPAVSSLMQTDKDWHPVLGFGERTRAAETSDLGQFKRDLESTKFTDADLLLLLGSTDCAPITHGKSGAVTNQDLAAKRAKFVQRQASTFGLSSLPTIVASAVPQAESCSKALERRAVYPLLFRPKAPK